MIDIATIKQVAAMAGVSPATVSKYLNGAVLKERNRIAVQNAIETLGFKVNTIARGLRTNKTMTIGILIHKLDNLFATSIVSIIENILLEAGYGTIICNYNSDADLEVKKFRFLLDKQVDGVIAIPYQLKEEELEGVDIPVVFIDRYNHCDSCHYVLIDNEAASMQAVEYLISKGHKKIGVLCEPASIYTANERLNGYKKALLKYGIPVNEAYVKRGDYDLTSVYDLVKELLDIADLPTAIFATNYEITLGAVIALNEMEIEIPNQISFVGFDNMDTANAIRPKLSIVAQPIKEIGETAAKLMLSKLKGDNVHPNMIELKSELIKQNSTKEI